MAVFRVAKAMRVPPFPGSLMEWTTEQFADAFAALIIMGEEEKAHMDAAKAESDARTEAQRSSEIQAKKGVGGGGRRVTSAPVEVTLRISESRIENWEEVEFDG